MRAIPNGRRSVPRLKRCWELFKGFICLSSLWDSNFTVISLLYQPYNSASYLCWTCRPISMTSFCLNFRNLPENDRTMSYHGENPTIILVSKQFQSSLPTRIIVVKGPVLCWDLHLGKASVTIISDCSKSGATG